MAFDPTTLLDVSYLVTFLGGAVVGAAGTYMADRFTDQRRASETKRSADLQFEEISRQMPQLFAELRNDLRENTGLFLREFVVLQSDGGAFNHDKPRIEIYETKHPAAKNQVGVLVSAGYVEIVRSTGTPIYRLAEHFAERLERSN